MGKNPQVFAQIREKCNEFNNEWTTLRTLPPHGLKLKRTKRAQFEILRESKPTQRGNISKADFDVNESTEQKGIQ